MRGALIAAVVLCLLVCLVVVNAVYVRRCVNDLRDMADALSLLPDEGAADAVGRMLDRLDREETLLGLSVSFTLIDRVRETAVSVRAYALDGQDAGAYLAARAALREIVDDLDRLEYVRLRNIM